jgi:N-acetylneuraminic acid mutarotase
VVDDEVAGRSSGHRRSAWLAGTAVLVVVAVVGVVVFVRRGDDDHRVTTPQPGPSLQDVPATTLTRPAAAGREQWTPMAASPLSGRANALTAWTGKELLVFRGDGAFSDAGGGEPGRIDGAAYDPKADRWRKLPTPPFDRKPPVFGADYASAWTGHELIVWGGTEPKAAAYDPVKDRWRELDAGPLEARVDVASAWTGKELVIFGGQTHASILDDDSEDEATGENDLPLDDGAAYDPVTGRWRRIPPSGAARLGAKAVWDGTDVLVLGGGSGSPASRTNGRQVLAWNPRTNRWRSLASPPFSGVRSAVWTGSRVVMAPVGYRATTLATFDPATNRWARTSRPLLPPGFRDRVETIGRWLPSLVWSGREVLLLGSDTTDPEKPQPLPGLAFDPVAGTWRTLPGSGLVRRNGSAAAWTGTELLLWGGAAYTGFTSTPYADGARYRPDAGH